ncbi:hypothetical protein [Bradyrhizobium sp. CCBAU 51753]|uniref:hypothetical protein n=1 Tax=Bradyrhizobium sp. CCBAU 51753 TaxID=1325100 RepID=UPI001FEF7049|nr:hypothetical protein [Bradyrhizobium sp. CCBAU 51753]
MFAGLDRQRPDQELAVTELNKTRFVVGAGELRRIVLEADDTASLRRFSGSIVLRRRLGRSAFVMPNSMSMPLK